VSKSWGNFHFEVFPVPADLNYAA